MKLSLYLLVTFSFVISFVSKTSAQDDVVRIETNLVSLNVAVTDKKGNYVRGLTKDGFVITDNGVKQDIDAFSSENAPASIGIIYDMHPTGDGQTKGVI